VHRLFTFDVEWKCVEYAERECGTLVWTKYPIEQIREKGFK